MQHLNTDPTAREALLSNNPLDATGEFVKSYKNETDTELVDRRLAIYGELRKSLWEAVEQGNAIIVDKHLLALQFMETALIYHTTARHLDRSEPTVDPIALEKVPELV